MRMRRPDALRGTKEWGGSRRAAARRERKGPDSARRRRDTFPWERGSSPVNPPPSPRRPAPSSLLPSLPPLPPAPALFPFPSLLPLSLPSRLETLSALGISPPGRRRPALGDTVTFNRGCCSRRCRSPGGPWPRPLSYLWAHQRSLGVWPR